MLSLARREFASFFQSATGVLVLSVYLGLNAVFFWTVSLCSLLGYFSS
jgi:hypothetical protein